MRVFFVQDPKQSEREHIQSALKKAVEDNLFQAQQDPIFSLAYDHEGHFFLKNHLEILWGKIIYSPFSSKELIAVGHEFEAMSKNFQKPLRPFIFFPKLNIETNQNAPSSFRNSRPRFFEYYYLESKTGQAIALKEWTPQANEGEPLKDRRVHIGSGGDGRYHFFRQAQLTREELSDLIQLSIEIRK